MEIRIECLKIRYLYIIFLKCGERRIAIGDFRDEINSNTYLVRENEARYRAKKEGNKKEKRLTHRGRNKYTFDKKARYDCTLLLAQPRFNSVKHVMFNRNEWGIHYRP